MENSKKWQRAELLIFTIVTIVNLLPFITTRFFPSMDGASHLSNSNIINQLIFHNNSLFRQFFMINPEPVPNWTSHLLISLCTLVMPAFLAEKILMVILLAGTPFAFRNLLQTISPKNTLFSFLVFPFSHSKFFFFGFFNFCMASLLFLVTLNYWLRHEQEMTRVKRIIILATLVALTYFSHIVVFGLLLIVIALHIVTKSAVALLCKKNMPGTILRNFLTKTWVISIAAIIPLLLFAYFLHARPGFSEIKYISQHRLFNMLISVRPMASLHPETEFKILVFFFFFMVSFIVFGGMSFAIKLIRRSMRSNAHEHDGQGIVLPTLNFWWLLVAMTVLLALYFKLPDGYGTASVTNLRIGFIFFLVMILWISTFRIPMYLGIIAATGGLAVNTLLILSYTPTINDLGKLAASCNKAADFVAPNSIVLPVYCMDNLFTAHLVDYLAVDKPVVLVNNYECQSGYFPVKWNEKLRPNYFMGNPATPEKYINFEIMKGKPSIRLDYVFVVGHCDPGKGRFFTTLHKILAEDYVCVYETENCSLYKDKLASTKQVR
jgi:hypothetical protein